MTEDPDFASRPYVCPGCGTHSFINPEARELFRAEARMGFLDPDLLVIVCDECSVNYRRSDKPFPPEEEARHGG